MAITLKTRGSALGRERRDPFALVGSGTLCDAVAYWATITGIYLMVGGITFYAGKEKLFDEHGHAPKAIGQQFANTFIDRSIGMDAAWTILGALELTVFAVIVLSLLRLEFLPHRDKWLLQVALSIALLLFAVLAFGQTVTRQLSGIETLYVYFGGTA